MCTHLDLYVYAVEIDFVLGINYHYKLLTWIFEIGRDDSCDITSVEQSSIDGLLDNIRPEHVAQPKDGE